MFDVLTRYISTISLAIVTALSLFNIGYFWKIGIHFLGLMDLSNLVYSFGVSSTALCVGVFITASVARSGSSIIKALIIGLPGVVLSSWGIAHFSPRTLDPELWENAAILVGFLLPASAFGSVIWRRPELATWSNMAALAFAWSVIACQAGVFQAAVELSDRIKYVVSTKNGVIENARIMRASSSGILLAVNGRITFVPQGEIKEISSQATD